MQNQNIRAVRIFRVRLPLENETQEIEFRVSMEGKLIGITNTAFFRKFLDAHPDGYELNKGDEIKVSVDNRQNIKFFTSSTPCWFKGCEELRESYTKEIEALEKRTGCKTGCGKGPIMQKYLQLVNKAVNSDV